MMTWSPALARPLCFGPRPRNTWMSIPATASDAELVGQIRRGNTEVFVRLVDRYSPPLYRYLRRLVGEPALAEDLLQETWLRVVERLDRYDSAQPFLTWLFAVGRHLAIDTLRKQARETFHWGNRAAAWENEEGEPLDPVERVAAEGPSPLAQLAEAELQRRVAELFAVLPRGYREVLTLRFQEDLKLEEIAGLLDLPLSTVKTRVQRGLLLLRQRAEGLGLNSNE